MLLRGSLDRVLVRDSVVHEKEDRHVEHSDELDSDTSGKRPLAANVIDEEERTEQRADKLDNLQVVSIV
jgi:hypothetical protein